MGLSRRRHIVGRLRMAFMLAAAGMLAVVGMGTPMTAVAIIEADGAMSDQEALRLGEQFGVVVGEVDRETADFLGLQRAEGVVVYEVIAGKPADLAGIKVKAVIKEIDKHEIRTLDDFGQALSEALKTDNFTVATYQPPDPDNQGVAGGLNFHFVRIEKN